jgi:hypothetical protein
MACITTSLVQLEEACVMVLHNLHGLNEDGSKPIFTVQVMLYSSEKFGPANVRDLSVRNDPVREKLYHNIAFLLHLLGG